MSFMIFSENTDLMNLGFRVSTIYIQDRYTGRKSSLLCLQFLFHHTSWLNECASDVVVLAGHHVTSLKATRTYSLSLQIPSRHLLTIQQALYNEKIASVPLTIAAMAYLPLNKASMLIYQPRMNSSAYMPSPLVHR